MVGVPNLEVTITNLFVADIRETIGFLGLWKIPSLLIVEKVFVSELWKITRTLVLSCLPLFLFCLFDIPMVDSKCFMLLEWTHPCLVKQAILLFFSN